jgi:hypothetical protein
VPGRPASIAFRIDLFIRRRSGVLLHEVLATFWRCPMESLVLPPRRSRTALVLTAGLGAAIAVAAALAGPWETVTERMPYGILGGAAFAVGGLLGWLAKRPR